VRTGEHPGQLHAPDIALHRGEFGGDLRLHARVGLGAHHLDQIGGVLQAAFDLGKTLDDRDQVGALLLKPRGLQLVGPEVRAFLLLVDGGDASGSTFQVKAASAARPAAP
jgi:hypothetical protein